MSDIQALFYETILFEEIESSSCFWIQRQFHGISTHAPSQQSHREAGSVLGPLLPLQEANSHFQLGRQAGRKERSEETAIGSVRVKEDSHSAGKIWSLGLKYYILPEETPLKIQDKNKTFCL